MNFVTLDLQKVVVRRNASFSLPINFTGVCIESRRTGENQDGEYIIADFKNDKGVEPIIQHEGIWAGWFTEQKIESPCFSENLKLMTGKNTRKPKFETV